MSGQAPTEKEKVYYECNNLDRCMQVQIRYACGHSRGGEFLKCRKHIKTEDERCGSRSIIHVDGKFSPHKCRACLRSPQ